MSSGGPTSGHRPVLYVALVLAAAVGAFFYQLRIQGIFACQSRGYDSDRYLAYCQASGYGDYDHGAFWFSLQPEAERHARSAEVLFLGNSRLQIGLSTAATANWFSAHSISYFMLGFAYHEKYTFEQALLRRLKPLARLYVINIDSFFEKTETQPAQTVMYDDKAPSRYRMKWLWQRIHKPACDAMPWICRNEYTFFRSNATGEFIVAGGVNHATSVAYDSAVDPVLVRHQLLLAPEFLQELPVSRDCVILTMVPWSETQLAMGRAIATALGMPLVAPELGDLQTFDGSHLDAASAERWSEEFYLSAGPTIQKCVTNGQQR